MGFNCFKAIKPLRRSSLLMSGPWNCPVGWTCCTSVESTAKVILYLNRRRWKQEIASFSCFWVNSFSFIIFRMHFWGRCFFGKKSFSTNWGNDCSVSFHSAASKLNLLIVKVCCSEYQYLGRSEQNMVT